MKEFEPAYATRDVSINGQAYTVRELSLDEFEASQEALKGEGKNAKIAATASMVSSGLVSPKLSLEQVRKLGLGTLMKLSTEIVAACGLGGDEKKEAESA